LLARPLPVFTTIASGIESSNWGTFFRRREPIRFWIGASMLTLCYAGMCLAGFVQKPGKQISGYRDVNLPAAISGDTPQSN
jgi:hypothetical protein